MHAFFKMKIAKYLKTHTFVDFCVRIRNTFVNLFSLYGARNICVCTEKYCCRESHLYITPPKNICKFFHVHLDILRLFWPCKCAVQHNTKLNWTSNPFSLFTNQSYNQIFILYCCKKFTWCFVSGAHRFSMEQTNSMYLQLVLQREAEYNPSTINMM